MATRADNLDGSCRQVLTGKHKGKWRVQFTQRDELEKKQRLSRLFGRQTGAKEFLRDLRHGVRVEAAKRSREVTLGEWFDWLVENDWPESLAESTIEARKARFKKYVRSVMGGVPLTRIDPLVVRRFYRSLRGIGVGQATVLEVKRDMVRVFNQAISPYRKVPTTWGNPFKLTLESPPRRTAVALMPEQARKALESKKLTDEQRAMLAVFLLSGVRLSEQMALTVGQLDFDNNQILVNRAVKVAKGGAQSIGLPKGDRIRVAVMCSTLKRILQGITQGMGPESVIWSAATENKPRMKKLVYATWRAIVKNAELPSEMSPHDCRLTPIRFS